MKSIMQSIRPIHCENIAIGRKEYELRKTKPNILTPFKVYIYCTKSKEHFRHGGIVENLDDLYRMPNGEIKYGYSGELMCCNEPYTSNNFLNGKVIGEYICDEIIEWTEDMKPPVPLSKLCLSYRQIREYGGDKPLYLWHITNLKIYDEPKELSEFYHYCGEEPNCKDCPFFYVESNEDVGTYEECQSKEEGWKPLTRPPQSWCYVEEV